MDHELCETLCALAASGQLGEAEREMLVAHCLKCCSCREYLADLSFVGGQLLLHAAPSRFTLPQGSLDRFRIRAVREGIPLRSASARGWLSYGLAPALVTAMFFCAGLGVFVHRVPASSAHAVPPAVVADEVHGQLELAASSAAKTARPVHSRTVSQRASSPQSSSLAARQRAFATMRLRGASSSSYLFGEAKPSSDASLYPALSGTELRRLDLFRALKEPPPGEPFGVAALDCPSGPSTTGCSFDFASNIRQLRFQIPATP